MAMRLTPIRPTVQEADSVQALGSMTLQDSAPASKNISVTPKPGTNMGNLLLRQDFGAWYESITTTRSAASANAEDVDDDPENIWITSKRIDSVCLAHWFHAYLLDHSDLFKEAADRDAAGKIFCSFYNQVVAMTSLEPFKKMEPLVMTRLRELKLLRSKRTDVKTVFMMFADEEGNFASAEEKMTARQEMMMRKKQEQANKHGTMVTEAPEPQFVPLGTEHVFDIKVGPDGAIRDGSEIVLKEVRLSGPNSNRYQIKEGSRLPTDLDSSRLFKFAVTPVNIGVVRANVTFVFRKNANEDFTIVRFFVFRSGDESMDKMLVPVAPYRRKKTRNRKQHVAPNKIHDAPPPSNAGNNPFKGKLKYYDVPKDITNLLVANEFVDAVGPLGEKIQNYAKFWHSLLWACEHQDMQDIQWYDMEAVRLQREGNMFVLRVPGLAESRPSVLRGDVIEINWKDQVYRGRVQRTRELEVVLQFAQSFQRMFNESLDRVDVRFTFSRMAYRTSHAGCNMARETMKTDLLFPAPSHVKQISAAACPRKEPYPLNKWMWANPSLNDEQKMAVQQIVRGSMRPLPYIIFGPPGTGKTMTVVETVYHLAKKCQAKVLLVAPSNDAADILVDRLASYFPPSELRRALAFSRSMESVPSAILPYVTVGGPNVQEILSEQTRIVVSTVNLAARFSYLGVAKGCFDVLMIDEAGHATEPEVIAVMASIMDFERKGQIILAGDPKQLGPVIRSEECNALGMSDSFMTRLMNRSVYMKDGGGYTPSLVTKLVKNYRSHPSIIKLPNEMFYDNELVCAGDPLVTHNLNQWEHLPVKKFPIIFHAIDGDNVRESNSPSWFNPQEAQQVVLYVQKLMSETRPALRADDIGIITPYARQAEKIRIVLNHKGFKDIKVGSVETFQGQERRCIIVSTVRSLVDEVNSDKRFNLGFVANEKRFNVAVTRAKALLIVIGCPRVLALDEANWLPFLRYCHENRAWCGDEWNPDVTPIKEDVGAGVVADEDGWDHVEEQNFAFTSREE
ncbi:hypothetical protein MPSEU_000865200 [Mayamaea pseudoterrestris]|nr:hypothetical protein MPSEU_000865200 [Mayamaea pseudoterrestris]